MLGFFLISILLMIICVAFDIWSFFSSECRSKREMPSLYPHAKGILYALKDKGIDVAIASRSPTSDIAKTFLDKLGIQPMFVAKVCWSKNLLYAFTSTYHMTMYRCA